MHSRISRIQRHSMVEELRNPEFYREIRSISDIGEECVWIHAMLSLYFHDAVHSNSSKNIGDISAHLHQLEMALKWHYRIGIEKCIHRIKDLMGEEFIDFEKDEKDEKDEKEKWINEKDDEKDDEKDEIKKIYRDVDLPMIKMMIKSKL